MEVDSELYAGWLLTTQQSLCLLYQNCSATMGFMVGNVGVLL
jgi:hypothetical protein